MTCYGSKVKYWCFNKNQPRTLVLIHGFRGTHHGLQKIIDRLPEYRIFIPDLPGFDQSTPMTERRHDIAGYADFVAAFIHQLNLEKPVLVGHSFGSIVAAAVAAKESKLLDKLVLINPIANPTTTEALWPVLAATRFYYWLGGVLPKKKGRALLANKLIVLAVSAAMVKTHKRALRREIHQSHLEHFSTFQDPKLLHDIFVASTKAAVRQYAEGIKTKTLLIAGAVDNIAPLPSQNELHRQLKHSELFVIPKVGHLVHHEAPKRAAQAIATFLSQQ